jgi:nicotinamidase-related amidase
MKALESRDPAALLVIDVQNYFFQQGSPAYLSASPQILPRINELIDGAVRAKWPIVLTSHHAPSETENMMGKKWRHHPRGEECSFYPGLRWSTCSLHLEKEYYSAFFKTHLQELLQQQNVKNLVICGVMTHLCVDTTARHAFMLGFEPTIVADACCSKTVAFHDGALLALGHGFAEVVGTEDVRGLQI